MAAGRGLKVSTFVADVTPPMGAPLCYGLVPVASEVVDKLWARGVVLRPAGERPIVLCAVDWLGIGNASRDRWREALAKAAGTVPERVALHTVHQHDAPGDDLSAHAFLPTGVPLCDLDFARGAVLRVAAAIKASKIVSVTSVTGGAAAVSEVASNRRILGPDGKVAFGRMTACRNSPQCAAPEGVIDPLLRSVSFWAAEKRVATLSYYATHPMSYYGKGGVSSDFVGQARDLQADTFQVHFTGAAGNIGAGKYNDGAPANRAVLRDRMADAMRRAKAAEKQVSLDAVRWVSESVAMPLRTGKGFGEDEIVAAIYGLSPDDVPGFRSDRAASRP